jgi:hypothetical protein
MSTHTYQEALNYARSLAPDEQLRLLEELAALVRQQYTARPKHSVMEFRGMAKKFWDGVDVDKFIDEERNSWDG